MIEKKFGDISFRKIPSVITIGVFDGLHLGHMEILKTCKKIANLLDAKTVLISFNINPKMALGLQTKAEDIISADERDNLLNELALDYHCVIDFSSYMSKLSGEEFIALLCTSYDVRAMVVGEDFRCGNSSSCASVVEIEQYLSRFTSSAFLKVVPGVLVDGEVVSSSLIRRCLLTGNLKKVERLLGRTYIPHEGQISSVK